MSTEVKNIAIVVFQYSVVVKGIERKMTGAYNVEIIQDFGLIKAHAQQTDVFIIYLPEDIDQDMAKLESLKRICNDIDEIRGKIILIGESRFHRELQTYVPMIKDRLWLDRPVI